MQQDLNRQQISSHYQIRYREVWQGDSVSWSAQQSFCGIEIPKEKSVLKVYMKLFSRNKYPYWFIDQAALGNTDHSYTML